MNGPVLILIAIGIIILLGLLYLKKSNRMNIIWEIERKFKKAQIRQDITRIEETYARASGRGKKINIISKGKVKKDFAESKDAYEKYIQFCESKGLDLTSDEQRLITIIEETEDFLDPAKALDRALVRANAEYDEVYQIVSASGEELLARREESAETIDQIEGLINSIAKHPKDFDKDIKEISVERTKFKDALEFGKEQQKALLISVEGAGAGVAAGATFASMAPTAAMWVATTFGTASTGTAISALSGAAATNAAVAWLGGGAVAAGGSGMAAGHALLALAGPIGWGVAGGSLLISVLLLRRNRLKIQESKKEEITRVKNCTAALKTLKADMDNLVIQTEQLHTHLIEQFRACSILRSGDYTMFSQDQKDQLGAIVNNTKALSYLLSKVLVSEESNDSSKRKRKDR